MLLTVNGGIPYSLTPYNDNTWAVGASLLDGTNTFTAVARDNLGRSDTNTSSFYLPVTNAFSYDLNGNLLSDGNRNFAYDDENQLISVWVTNNWRSDFVYDGKMRRRMRFESNWNGTTWVTNTTVLYVYDENLVIQERHFDPQLSTTIPQQSITYTRGRDLSGTLQGAGGIGGLLARSDSALLNAGSSSGHSFYHADGNGNVTALIYPNQTFAAKYLYDAFGNILSKAGALADANLYRFSSKEAHPLSGLVYYLYRFYDPSLDRWLNRDPLGDEQFLRQHSGRGTELKRWLRDLGTRHLFNFVDNFPTGNFDSKGLAGYGPGYDAEECQALENLMEFFENLYEQKGVDKLAIAIQLMNLNKEHNDNCPDDDGPGLPETPPVVAPSNGKEKVLVACEVAGGAALAYGAYRVVRMLPSVIFPPLWPTIPVNAVVP